MKITYNSIQINIVRNYSAMSKKAANIIAGQINIKNNSVLGLATGSTPEGMYKELVVMYNNEAIDFSEITTFNLDEYYCLSKNNPQSYAHYMNHHLFNHVNMPMDSQFIPNGLSEDVETVCKAYDRRIEACGNIDIQVLGIGTNGHIGFNEPDIKFEAGTHLVQLDQETIKANARFFDSINDVPREAISMGVRNIMHAKKLVLLASGLAKAGILAEMLFGPVTPNVPASVIQLHNDVTLILDEAAASVIVEHLILTGYIEQVNGVA